MQKAYKLSVIYFLAFSTLLLLSGFMLFEHKIGFEIDDILSYYLGCEEKYTLAKTYEGVLKVVLPHIFAFGLLLMVLLHFLTFTLHKNSKKIVVLIYLVFFSAFIEIFSPFVIIYGAYTFAYLKLFSFVVLEVLILYTSWLLFSSIMKN